MKNLTGRMLAMGVAIAATGFTGIKLECQARSFPAEANTRQADNTGTNKQNTPTADQQKNNPADRELAQKIRQAINSDKSISTDGHNVKVIVRDGLVTLKGPVKSEEEKKNIEGKASDLAGADKVTDKLTVR